MRIRYMSALILLLLVLGLAYVSEFIRDDTHLSIDMIEYNEKYKQFEQLCAEGKSFEEAQDACDCIFLPVSDEFYRQKSYREIKSGKVLIDYYDAEGAFEGRLVFDGTSDKYLDLLTKLRGQLNNIFFVIAGIIGLFLVWIYVRFIRPFSRMQKFAVDVAKGNLDVPLKMQKYNYFGAFTESFDLMREELKAAKEGEYQANASKKELVASLSHDIKTPVSTIKAICELLMLKVEEEQCQDKIQIISQKSDMIDSLISNMFQATLEELEALSIEPSEELSTIIRPMFDEFNYYGKIIYDNEIPECLIYADKLRLNQVIDNIINNSYKYADTDIHIFCRTEEEGIRINIADNGPGVKDDEIALITEKYFRGGNVKGKSGSGLGLYLSNMFMEGMKGSLECYNENGFVAELFIRRV